MSDELQFEEAEYDAPPQMPTACAACQSDLGASFWVENRRYALCGSCKAEREADQGGGMASLARGFALGLVAAVGAGALWGVITAVTGFNIGLIAIAVGFAVAVGIQAGAGRGGWMYQVMAVALTYFAICFNEVVIYAWYAYTEQGMGLAEVLLSIVIGVPMVLVMLIPSTISGGGFISLLIYGFAIYQAFQMTAGSPPVYEGPFATAGA